MPLTFNFKVKCKFALATVEKLYDERQSGPYIHACVQDIRIHEKKACLHAHRRVVVRKVQLMRSIASKPVSKHHVITN